jgi:hypothetical protein
VRLLVERKVDPRLHVKFEEGANSVHMGLTSEHHGGLSRRATPNNYALGLAAPGFFLNGKIPDIPLRKLARRSILFISKPFAARGVFNGNASP